MGGENEKYRKATESGVRNYGYLISIKQKTNSTHPFVLIRTSAFSPIVIHSLLTPSLSRSSKTHRGTPSPPFLEDSVVAGVFLQHMFFFLHQGAARHHVLLHRPQVTGLRPEGDERVSRLSSGGVYREHGGLSADGLVPIVSSSLSCLDLTTIFSLSHTRYSSFCENVLVAAFCEATRPCSLC